MHQTSYIYKSTGGRVGGHKQGRVAQPVDHKLETFKWLLGTITANLEKNYLVNVIICLM
jgi:hypothetical protein